MSCSNARLVSPEESVIFGVCSRTYAQLIEQQMYSRYALLPDDEKSRRSAGVICDHIITAAAAALSMNYRY
jgi:hypothetical protein